MPVMIHNDSSERHTQSFIIHCINTTLLILLPIILQNKLSDQHVAAEGCPLAVGILKEFFFITFAKCLLMGKYWVSVILIISDQID